MGFRVTALFERDGVVAHAQLAWGDGAINLHSRADPSRTGDKGAAACYLMARSREEVDELYERVRRAGAELPIALEDQFTGNHQFTVRDPEGNLWSVGVDWLQTEAARNLPARVI